MKHWMAAAVVVACGCDRGGPAGGSREEHYRAFTRKFGEAIQNEKFKDAYAMTSREYQAATSAEEMEHIFRTPAQRTGKPTAIVVDLNSVSPEDLSGKTYDGHFAQIPGVRRRARMSLTFKAEKGEFECWLNIVEEGGSDRIAVIEAGWSH